MPTALFQEGDIVNVRSAGMPQYNRDNAVVVSVHTNTYGRSYYRIKNLPSVVFIEESIHPAEDPKLTNEAIFTMFLKKHRKYAAFKRNLKHSTSDFFCETEVSVLRAMSGTFSWEISKEGNAMWRQLNRQWRAMCEDLNINGNIDVTKLK